MGLRNFDLRPDPVGRGERLVPALPMEHEDDNGRRRPVWLWRGAAFAGLVAASILAGGRGPAACGGGSRAAAAASRPGDARGQRIETWDDRDSPVPISGADPTWGSRDALVTLVVYDHLSCVLCRDAEEMLDELRSFYGEHNLRIVWKNVTVRGEEVGRRTEAALGVFELAGADAFWAFRRNLLDADGVIPRERLEAWAADAGVTDISAYRDGLDTHRWAAKADNNGADARRLRVGEAPTYFVNGARVEGSLPDSVLRSVIDPAIERAKEKVASGTSGDRLYVELTKDRLVRIAAARELALENDGQDTTTVFRVPVGTSPVLGEASAAVTIVEFGDFACRYCAKAQATLDALRAKYGRQLRLVWKDRPFDFHVAAEPAAEAAAEVRAEKGDDAFWSVHDTLLSTRSDLARSGKPNLDAIVSAAVQAGASAVRVGAAVRARGHRAQIEDDLRLAEALDAGITPEFFINGRRLIGARNLGRVEKIIDEEIAKAAALVTAGTAPADVYDALTRDGRTDGRVAAGASKH
ncbi:MAG TPA: thioredoxin domain-containing protein [Polyangiaceae bacterium]|nr:thioredoxin domain-containing protein [Polyangiaceae bacterium]